MLFLKCTGNLIDESLIKAMENANYKEQRKMEAKIQKATSKMLQSGNEVFFLSDIDNDMITIGAITEEIDSFNKKLKKFIVSIGMPLDNIKYDEITYQEFDRLLDWAITNDYVQRCMHIYRQFGLKKNSSPWEIDCDERIMDERSKTDIYERAGELFNQNSLLPELNRIYEGKKLQKAKGIPVHYLIQTDEYDLMKKTIDVLCQALYSNGRINSKRITKVELSVEHRHLCSDINIKLEYIYQRCKGGALVIHLNCSDEIDGEYASSMRGLIEKISNSINKFSKKILTIFCLPKECIRIKEWFYEALDNVTIIEIKEEFITAAEAENILKGKAKEHHVRADKQLLEQIDENKKYLLRDLNKDFEKWYHEKLKRTVYPQYQCIESVTNKKLKEVPKGTAYEELEKMIGLAEAKKVINNALDYYKAQKLFRDKGMNEGNPSMHMIFTGNPGTAKTTVARLFADIMKDNGILETGRLVEVGRGDIVGKYVGWTADIVKSKFKEASGGVLFIDEAYSLVDDRDGLYGDEAINTIVQEMENHRDEVIVIFAGYPDKMEGFMDKNPGLRSRIAFHVPFEDYNVEELCRIAEFLAEKKGIHFTDDAMEKLKENFETAVEQSDFGNGRYVRNVLEKSRMAQMSRLVRMNAEEIGREEIATLCAEDIELPKLKKENKIVMGFAC